jgi:hypothetical protein
MIIIVTYLFKYLTTFCSYLYILPYFWTYCNHCWHIVNIEPCVNLCITSMAHMVFYNDTKLFILCIIFHVCYGWMSLSVPSLYIYIWCICAVAIVMLFTMRLTFLLFHWCQLTLTRGLGFRGLCHEWHKGRIGNPFSES